MFVWMTRRKAGRFVLTASLLVVIAFGSWNAARVLVAHWHKRQAEKALERQRYPQALASYERAIHYRPDSAELHLLAARTARQAGDFPAAREHLHQCRELQKGVTEEQQVEGYLLRVQSGEIDEVYKFLMPYLIEEGPLTPYVLEGMARAYMSEYRPDLAWGCLARWIEIQPTNVAALLGRGTWYAQQQDMRGATDDLHRALQIDPERIDIRLTYAEIIRTDKKFTEVAEQYRLVLRQEPLNAEAMLGLAQAYRELGRMEEAREQLAAMPADKRDSPTFLWISGMVEFRSDHLDKAEPLLRQACERDPRNLDACYNLMLCLTHLGREGDAAQVRIRFERIEKDQKRLIELTTRDFAAQPSNPELRCELGEIYLRMALRERGVHWFLIALGLDSNCRRAHQRLCEYYESLGGSEAAEKAAIHRRHLLKPR